ncbi:MAG: hypothetical protein Q7R65_04960 [bacterium]|nr:hypothetical protein [bacterium]
MNKKEIIEAIAYANVDPKAILVEHSNPTPGFLTSSFGPGQTDGLEILAAREFVEVLERKTVDCPDVPESQLFEQLHEASLKWHQAEIEGLAFQEVEAEVVAEHKKLVERLRQIAQKLGITYQEPEDPLLSELSESS